MTQRELEVRELTRIIDLTQRLEHLKAWLAKGYKRSLPQRRDAWCTIQREATAQLASYEPVAVETQAELPNAKQA